MYATVTRAQLQPGKIEEGLALWHQWLLPALKQQKGFLGAQVLVQRQDDRGISIVFWQSEADAEAARSDSAFTQALSHVVSLFATAPEREGYEVGLQELRAMTP